MPLKSRGEVYKGFEPYLPSLWRTEDQPKNRNTFCHLETEKAAECIFWARYQTALPPARWLAGGIRTHDLLLPKHLIGTFYAAKCGAESRL